MYTEVVSMVEYRIGLYDERKNLIGYKTDTFRSLTKKSENAKRHGLVNGSIPVHLISNLGKVLARFFDDFETMLIGYDHESMSPIFTHRIFPERVELLTSEDLLRLENKT